MAEDWAEDGPVATREPVLGDVRTPWGALLTVDVNDHSHREPFLTTGVSWIEEAFRRAVWTRPGFRVVDVGASYGYLSSLFAHCVGPGGEVIAFEPTTGSFELLRANMSRNHPREVRCRRIAISDHDGEETIYLDSEYLACHSVVPNISPSPSGSYERVAALTLDSALSALGLDDDPIDLLKIDVEGAEGRVLVGAARTLRSVSRVWLEFWPDGLAAAGTDPSAVFDRHVEH